MKTCFPELRDGFMQVGGFMDIGFNARVSEHFATIVVPRHKKQIWGFGISEDSAILDAARQFEEWLELKMP